MLFHRIGREQHASGDTDEPDGEFRYVATD